MAGIDKTGKQETDLTLQKMNIESYDREFNILARESIVLNPVTNTLERLTAIPGNSSLALGYDGDGNLTTIEKIVDGNTYTKTLSYSGGRLSGITVWT
jgi:hypothetical protein